MRQAGGRPGERIEQEDQRQREQQVRAAEDHRLGRAEGGDVHVVERHRHRDGATSPAQRRALGGAVAALPRRRRRCVVSAVTEQLQRPIARTETGRPAAAPSIAAQSAAARYIAPTSL